MDNLTTTNEEKNSVKWHQSIFFKFALSLIIIITISLFAVSKLISSSQTKQFIEHAVSEAGKASIFINTQLEKEMLKGLGLENIRPLINLFAQNGKIDKIMLINMEGVVRHSNDSDLIGYRFIINDHEGCMTCHRNLQNTPDNFTVITKNQHGKKIIRTTLPLQNKQECHICHSSQGKNRAMLVVDTSFSELEQTLSSINDNLFFGLRFITFFIILVILVFLYFYFSRPFKGILKGIKEIGEGNMDYKIQQTGKDELSLVGETLNQMALDIKRHIAEVKHKNLELNALYSAVNQLSKTMDLDELRTIIIDIFLRAFNIQSVYILINTFAKDEVEIISKLIGEEQKKYTGKTEDSKRYIETVLELMMKEDLNKFITGKLNKEHFSADRRYFLIPLYLKNDPSFGFVLTGKKKGEIFDSEDEQKTLIAIVSHISVAVTNARLYSQSITDDLSRLYTKNFFMLRASEEIQRNSRYGNKFSLMMIDIDKFKNINDTHGHLAGDLAIRKFSHILKTNTRSMDICARYGGDEFIVLLPNASIEQAITVAEKVREKMEKEEIFIEESKALIKVTLSLGIAHCPSHATELEDLIAKADIALYQSKEAGRNRISVFSA